MKFFILVAILSACALAGCAGDDRPQYGWSDCPYLHDYCDYARHDYRHAGRAAMENAP